jgi:hypothetical protein
MCAGVGEIKHSLNWRLCISGAAARKRLLREVHGDQESPAAAFSSPPAADALGHFQRDDERDDEVHARGLPLPPGGRRQPSRAHRHPEIHPARQVPEAGQAEGAAGGALGGGVGGRK